MFIKWSAGFFAGMLLLAAGAGSAFARDPVYIKDLRQLLQGQQEWIKVHVAEYLVWSGAAVNEVYRIFREEDRLYAAVPKYRIGIWRVLAQASRSKKERARWVRKIAAVYRDTTAPDRLHAIETLSKLRYPVLPEATVNKLLREEHTSPMQVYELWNATGFSAPGNNRAKDRLVTLLLQQLAENDHAAVPVIAYVLRFLHVLEASRWDQVRHAADLLPTDPAIHAALLTTLWIAAPAERSAEAEAAWSRLFRKRDEKEMWPYLLAGLALKGTKAGREWLLQQYPLLSNSRLAGYNADVHAAAAYALLKMEPY
ncbi:hypothetical protein [Niabella drilacis]|uniref:Solute:Na+ symporter, SSS family n=1 Tax=Niabella drilacis (strain DSM 25811 / CCM 8410 / CCUG 62505 / LMG 26954 / E90) TaxID=1285928 RepID=A0A1G6Y136_NIADE|nr:solute:Na+ symporter, SSS family [Niabella drilacis]